MITTIRRALMCVALAAVVPTAALAQVSEAEVAVRLGNEGVELFKQGKWKEARARFEAAEKMVHSPVLVVYAARSMRNAGELLAARAAYARVAAEQIPADAPPQWQQAKDDAAREGADLQKRIPSLAVLVRGATQPSSITVDGVELPRERWGSAVQVDPGRHVVVAKVTGSGPVESSTVVAEGDPPHTLVIDLGVPAKPAPPPSGGLVTPDTSGSGSIWPGIVTLGVGSLALGTGIVTGRLATSKEAEVIAKCPDNPRCPASLEGEADTAKSLATVSTIGFVAAAIAVPAGVVLLVWRPFGRTSANVVVGPSHLAVAGSF